MSPISNRQIVSVMIAQGRQGIPQAGSTAIQQVGNLRYAELLGPCHRQGRQGEAISQGINSARSSAEITWS